MMGDRHVVKMVLETAQLLSTAHRTIDGVAVTNYQCVQGSLPARFRKKRAWILHDSRDRALYKATHVNHPSAIWARSSNNNYNWLYCHFTALLNEYTYRFKKVHKCDSMKDVLTNPPNNIAIGHLTQPTPAMPDEYKVAGDSLQSYRNYYRYGKTHLHKFTNRNKPVWL